ncbi:MAG: VCBS repeat-containing protein [Planctomycetota bacterium]
MGSFGGADRPYVFINDGAGNFTIDLTRFPQSPSQRWSPAIADFDRDGDLDVAFGGETFGSLSGRVELWLNDGTGHFTDVTSARMPAGLTTYDLITAGDLDGDGAPDLVIGRGNWGSPNPIPKRILWNDGSGYFTVQTIPPAGMVRRAFILDVDGDGDDDLFFQGHMQVFRNDGGRQLTLLPFPPIKPLWVEYSAAVGDVNVDGFPDIVFSGAGPEPSVLLNDGHGGFVDSPGWIHGAWRSNLSIDRLAFADLDGDGDEDAFANGIGLFGPPPSTGAVLFNLHRQVWGLPSAPRGGTYRVEVCGRVGTVFAVGLSAQRATIPISLGAPGLWHLDPSSTTMLGTLAMDVVGKGELPLRIPNLAFLAGRTFYVQGIDFGDGSRPLHATGWWPFEVQ